jgi:hypothetical protein
VDLSRVTFGEALAAVCGFAFACLMFTSWYTSDLVAVQLPGGTDFTGAGGGVSGWMSFGFPFDLLLFLVAFAAVVQAVLRYRDQMPELPATPASVVAAAGAFATLLVLYRLLDPPHVGDVTRRVPLLLSLVTATGIGIGGYLGMAERPSAEPRRPRLPHA